MITIARVRNKQNKFWSTEEEAELIKEKAKQAKLNYNEYILRSTLGTPIIVIDEPKAFHQLAGMANNLNQLTHLCHIGKIKEPEILMELQEIMKGVNELLLLFTSLIQKIKRTKTQSRAKPRQI